MLEDWYNNGPLGPITKHQIQRALEASAISKDVLVSECARIAMANMSDVIEQLEDSEICTDKTGTRNMMHPNKLAAIKPETWPAIKKVKTSRGGRYSIEMVEKLPYFRLLAEMTGVIGPGGAAAAGASGTGSGSPKLTIEIVSKKK